MKFSIGYFTCHGHYNRKKVRLQIMRIEVEFTIVLLLPGNCRILKECDFIKKLSVLHVYVPLSPIFISLI